MRTPSNLPAAGRSLYIAAWAALSNSDLFPALTAITVFVAGRFVKAPVMPLIGATALALPPLLAAPAALGGCLASAAVSYAVGYRLGRNTIRRLGGKRLNRRLAHHGILAVAKVRQSPSVISSPEWE